MSKEAELDGGGKEETDIVAAVQQYLFEAEDFEETFMKWGQDHCDCIELDSDEMKLEYTTLHNKFMEFFESKIEEVITRNGSDVKTFYKLVKQRSLEDPDGDDSNFVQIMLALVEFEVFMQMMQEAKIAKLASAGKK